MVFRSGLLYCAALITLLGRTDALSSEDKEKLREGMQPYVASCIEEFGVSQEKVSEIEKSGKADDIDTCLLACIFQKIGIMDNKGLFDVEKAVGMTKPFITNEDDVKIVEKVAEICSKVNDEDLSDDDKGCKRSKLLFECMMEHKND